MHSQLGQILDKKIKKKKKSLKGTVTFSLKPLLQQGPPIKPCLDRKNLAVCLAGERRYAPLSTSMMTLTHN